MAARFEVYDGSGGLKLSLADGLFKILGYISFDPNTTPWQQAWEATPNFDPELHYLNWAYTLGHDDRLIGQQSNFFFASMSMDGEIWKVSGSIPSLGCNNDGDIIINFNVGGTGVYKEWPIAATFAYGLV